MAAAHDTLQPEAGQAGLNNLTFSPAYSTATQGKHMRIGLMSDIETHDDLLAIHQYAVALTQQDVQVLWVASTETAAALSGDTGLIATDIDTLPATCRHVVPCQPYQLSRIQLVCVDRTLWQDSMLHTRLFTFLCLLHDALPCTVLHAWGSLPAAYLAVYTARFLDIPAAVSYSALCLDASLQETFAWQWVARHTAMALTTNLADQQRLLTSGAVEPARLSIMDPALPATATTMTTLYQSLNAR